jgi:hypothetical protein
VASLQLDVEQIQRGQSGYGEGRLGQAEMGSEARQFGIGDASARAGAGRSGMRANAASTESAQLQDALLGLSRQAGGDFTNIQNQYIDLYNEIYRDLAEEAELQLPPADPAVGADGADGGGGEAAASGGQAAKPTLSGGKGGLFLSTLKGIGSQRELSKPEKIRRLRALVGSYTLTAAQRKYLDSYLRSNFGVGLG